MKRAERKMTGRKRMKRDEEDDEEEVERERRVLRGRRSPT